ncbi:hypothetical protein M8C21_015513, partial [Ambrosia artemisiifolia]
MGHTSTASYYQNEMRLLFVIEMEKRARPCNKWIPTDVDSGCHSLRSFDSDLEEVTTFYVAFLSIHHVQMAIKNKSPYWRGRAATTIQVAWRYRRKRRNSAATSRCGSTYPSNKL